MRTVRVSAPGGRYPVYIGAGVLDQLPRILAGRGGPTRVHLVSDEKVHRLHRRKIEPILAEAGLPVSRTIVPSGEESKSIRRLNRIWRDMLTAGCDRNSWVVAFGGGMVGDLAGFAASTALRGVPFVQVPTTLLAMVDASVGGKTGINLPEGKNLVGAFHQPQAVIADLELLSSLSRRERSSGWAEVIKTAAIGDARLFRELERDHCRLWQGDLEGLSRVVRSCVRVKAAVVAEDEREEGLRRILNFGHTLGHGIEAAGGYSKLLHGEAVAIGMVFAGKLGETLDYTEPGTAGRLCKLARAFRLPTSATGLSYTRVAKIIGRDKKKGPAGLRWVLLTRPGKTVVVDELDSALVAQCIRAFLTEREWPRNGASRP